MTDHKPIMPATQFEKFAWLDGLREITVRADYRPKSGEALAVNLPFTPGKAYAISTNAYKFTEHFHRQKIEFDEDLQQMVSVTHQCSLRGFDRYVSVIDDTLVERRFMHHFGPNTGRWQEHPESWFWQIFDEPPVETVGEAMPELVAANRKRLLNLEMRTLNFKFYPGQLDYLARVAVKDSALVVADTGCGKSLMAVALARLKLEDAEGRFHGRCLIIAPGGTLRVCTGEEDGGPAAPVSQWRQEIARFAPHVPVYPVTLWEEYLRYLLPDGTLPEGIFVTYYEAAFRNQARESLPASWTNGHERLCKEFNEGKLGPVWRQWFFNITKGTEFWFRAPVLPSSVAALITAVGQVLDYPSRFGEVRIEVTGFQDVPTLDYAEGVGREEKGIRCIVAECLMSRIQSHQHIVEWNKHWKTGGRSVGASENGEPRITSYAPRESCWDMIALDEAHTCTNLSAQVTQSLIRMQPKYRFAFTATPIPNLVSNLFCLMGWVCVPNWYRGKQRNTAWPYAREEAGKFSDTFLATETDHTAARNSKSKALIARPSAVISYPARLLKLLKPSLAFISKIDCNPEYQPAQLLDVRVPMGADQARLYAYFLNRGNIPASKSLVRAWKQIAYLRNICADPAGFRFGGPPVSSNFNPKILTALELIRKILGKGEQVNVICARVGQSDTLHDLLRQAGIATSRIDSTIPADQHQEQARRFKNGETCVNLMGIKCAAGHSFSDCANEIILSLEYSFGTLHQARGRVDRVNSRPGVRIYCILHKDSIEEAMFDRVATKEAAATICLRGQRIRREFAPGDPGEVLAENVIRWEKAARGEGNEIQVRQERDCAEDWPKLCDELKIAGACGRNGEPPSEFPVGEADILDLNQFQLPELELVRG